MGASVKLQSCKWNIFNHSTIGDVETLPEAADEDMSKLTHDLADFDIDISKILQAATEKTETLEEAPQKESSVIITVNGNKAETSIDYTEYKL